MLILLIGESDLEVLWGVIWSFVWIERWSVNDVFWACEFFTVFDFVSFIVVRCFFYPYEVFLKFSEKGRKNDRWTLFIFNKKIFSMFETTVTLM